MEYRSLRIWWNELNIAYKKTPIGKVLTLCLLPTMQAFRSYDVVVFEEEWQMTFVIRADGGNVRVLDYRVFCSIDLHQYPTSLVLKYRGS